MTLRCLTKITELAEFCPKLVALHSTLEGKWEPDLTQGEFFISILNNFEQGSYFFGDFTKEGEIAYFAVLAKENATRAFFWLFYMNAKLRTETKGILDDLRVFMKAEGFFTVCSNTTRMTRSYERWIQKFGAEKVAITYQFNL